VDDGGSVFVAGVFGEGFEERGWWDVEDWGIGHWRIW